VLGERLDALPPFRLGRLEEIRDLPDRDVEAQLRWRFADLDPDTRARASRMARQARASATVARYAAGVILALPGQQAVLAHWDESLAQAQSPAFLQLALVHEVVRGLLETKYDLPRRYASCRDAEDYQVLRALEEGWAQWVTREVARRLGTESCFPLLAERLRHVPDPAADPGLRLVAQTGLRLEHWALVQGLSFFTYLEEHGGKEAAARAFRQPPPQTRWIEQPELYVRAAGQARPDLASLLARVEQCLAASEWQAAQQSWTPEMVAQVAALLGERDRAERVLAGWEEGRSLVWTKRGMSGRQVALSVVRLGTSAGARSYYGLAVDLQRKRDELTGQACGGQVRVLEARSSALQLPGVDEGARFDKQLQFGSQTPSLPAALILARAGNVVVELTWHGVEADPALAERVLRALLTNAE
jgi:hypothetical protein